MIKNKNDKIKTFLLLVVSDIRRPLIDFYFYFLNSVICLDSCMHLCSN